MEMAKSDIPTTTTTTTTTTTGVIIGIHIEIGVQATHDRRKEESSMTITHPNETNTMIITPGERYTGRRAMNIPPRETRITDLRQEGRKMDRTILIVIPRVHEIMSAAYHIQRLCVDL